MHSPCSSPAADTILILPCSGPCSVGQLSHQAAVALAGEGFGSLCGLAGIAAGIEPFVAAARAARLLVAVDGCDTACSLHSLEKSGIPCTHHLVVTDLGLARDGNLQPEAEDRQLVKDAIQACCAEAKPIVRLGGCMCGI